MDEYEQTQAGHVAEDMFVRQMKRRRMILGLSQNDLAERVSALGGAMFQQTIAKIEAGQRAVKLAEADLLARALDSSVSDFLKDAVDEAAKEDGAELSIDDLRSLVRAAERRRAGAQYTLEEATKDDEKANARLASARQHALLTKIAKDRADAFYRDADKEYRHLQSLLLDRTHVPAPTDSNESGTKAAGDEAGDA